MVTSRRAFIGYGSVLAGGFIAGWWSVGLVEYMGSASDTPWKTLPPDEADTLDRAKLGSVFCLSERQVEEMCARCAKCHRAEAA